jgi:hypothetical protein
MISAGAAAGMAMLPSEGWKSGIEVSLRRSEIAIYRNDIAVHRVQVRDVPPLAIAARG